MNKYYLAFVKLVTALGSNQSELESALHSNSLTIENFTDRIEQNLGIPYSHFFNLPRISFNFGNTREGISYWLDIFRSLPNYRSLTLGQALEPYLEQPLTNEQILVTFLKHYRKFSWFKKELLKNNYIKRQYSSNLPLKVDFTSIPNLPPLNINRHFRGKLLSVIDNFAITGDLDLVKLLKTR